jgi:hypothetical protein
VNRPTTPGIAAGRLPREVIAENFADIHPDLDPHEAMVAADRCYFCHDAPCITACPTEIDIPLFIRQIQAGQPEAAARTIFEQNILGGMCARVCPTDHPVRGRLRARGGRRQAGGDRPAAAPRHRPADGAQRSPFRARRPDRASGWRWSAPGRPGWPARTGWRCTAMTWWSSRPARSPAG